MAFNSSLNSTDSDGFYVEQSSNDQNVPRPNTPIVLNSTEISGDETREMISISSIASPEPQIVTIDDDSTEPTMPYGFGRQLPIVPPNLNHLNLPPNPFNILATMAIANNSEEANDNSYSPQSHDPSVPSPISTPPMSKCLQQFGDVIPLPLTTTHSTQATNPEGYISFLQVPHRRHHLRGGRKKIEPGNVISKRGGLSQRVCEACGQTIPSAKDTPGPSRRS